MPVIITSSTDSPEDVAAAMGVEPEGEEVQEEAQENQEGGELEVTPQRETPVKGNVKLETDDEEPAEEEEELEEGEEETVAEAAKPKKISGYKKKALRLEEENRLLLDLLSKHNNPEPKEEPKTEAVTPGIDPKTKTYSGIARPKLIDFKEQQDPYAAFTEASTDWALKEGKAQAQFEQQQNAREEAQTVQQTDFQGRLTEVRKEGGIYADYDEVLDSIKGEDLPISSIMQHMIMNSRTKDGSSISVDVMYYLASNPDRVREIASLPPEEQAAEMGLVRREAWAETEKRTAALTKGTKKSAPTSGAKTLTELNAGANTSAGTSTPQPKPKAKTPPPPIKPVGKRSAPASGDMSALEFKDYEARRLQQGFRYK